MKNINLIFNKSIIIVIQAIFILRFKMKNKIIRLIQNNKKLLFQKNLNRNKKYVINMNVY